MGIGQHKEFTLEKTIQIELQKRKIVLITGDRKLVSKFSKDKTAKPLLNFLKIHKSYRVLLNAIVKSNWIDLNAIKKNLKDLLKYSDCSFVYEATCKCGALSDKGWKQARVDGIRRLRDLKASYDVLHRFMGEVGYVIDGIVRLEADELTLQAESEAK